MDERERKEGMEKERVRFGFKEGEKGKEGYRGKKRDLVREEKKER